MIDGLFLLGATALGSILTIFAGRSQAKISDLKDKNTIVRNRLKKALQQIEAYHLLEDTYANKLAHMEGKAVRTIKSDYRDKVVEEHQCERPYMTANEAQKQVNHIS